jgi:phospholipid-translocating ATPase
VQIENALGFKENFDIMADFPFESNNRKQSILVQNRENGKFIYYAKGAEIVLEPLIQESQRPMLIEFCEQLAVEGLRTLVFAQKVLSDELCDEFMVLYEEAISADPEDKAEILQEALAIIEQDMNFLGVSGVEEFLQENAKDTIQALKNANIKLWMFTGDKVENTASIALSSGLKSPNHEFYFITNNFNKTDILFRISQFNKVAKNTVLIVDGKCLEVILEYKELVYQFFKAALRAPNVCLCRCSPT